MFDGLRSSTFSSSQVRSDLLEVRFDSISLFSFEIIYKQIEPKWKTIIVFQFHSYSLYQNLVKIQ